MIHAIETRYQGYRFRSRLEARWAVFFDSIGLTWVYEPEGFVLDNGIKYLPDFRIVEWGTYIEVKPTLPTYAELQKIVSLAQAIRGSQQPAPTQVMLCGTPGIPQLHIKENVVDVGGGYVALSMSGLTTENGPFVSIESFAMTQGGENLDIWPIYFRNPRRMPITPVNVSKNEQSLLSLTLFHGIMPRHYFGDGVQYDAPLLQRGYEAARSARFEHGETPKVQRGRPKPPR
jgi:hypothetical protein